MQATRARRRAADRQLSTAFSVTLYQLAAFTGITLDGSV